MLIDALSVLCAQLTRDLLAIANFLYFLSRMPSACSIIVCTQYCTAWCMNIIIQYVQIKLSLTDPWGFIIVPIPIPHSYPWESPWESPYPRQPWKFLQWMIIYFLCTNQIKSNRPMGIHHSPHTHPTLIPMGIPVRIPIPTAALKIPAVNDYLLFIYSFPWQHRLTHAWNY